MDRAAGARLVRSVWIPLSSMMILVVTGVGFLIHVYSVGYMAHEEGYWRYFAYLNLFMAMMLTLVLGASLPLLFVGWEGVGLCSYLLIGFYYEKSWCADAGRKAFLVNRIGDTSFILGMLWAFVLFGGTFDIATTHRARAGCGAGVPRLGCTAIVSAAVRRGRAASRRRFPLYVWLPDAMAGPTPVSALIHAATMVTAGVYMVCRLLAALRAGALRRWSSWPSSVRPRRCSPPSSRWRRTTSRRCWPTPPSRSWGTCSWRRERGPSPPRSST